jgi:hypothetical protein
MDPKTIGNYGGPKIDALPVSNPETQVAASEMNRYMEDMAQTTRTVLRAAVTFPTDLAAAPLTIPPGSITNRSVWGSGPAQKPVITKTGVGLYTLTFPATFTDALGTVETVAFYAGHGSCMSADVDDDIAARTITLAANVVTIGVYAAGVLADDGNVSTLVFPVTVWLL